MGEQIFVKIRKRLVISLLTCFLILGIIPSALGSNAQDEKWTTNCMNISSAVANDIKNSIAPIKNNDLESLSKCADNIAADSQVAIDTSNSYEVSPSLQSIKDEYNVAMEQAGQIATCLTKLVNEAENGNKEGIKYNYDTAGKYLTSYNQHMKSVYSQVEVIINTRHATRMNVITNVQSGVEYKYKP
jgi:hypothetical protein